MFARTITTTEYPAPQAKAPQWNLDHARKLAHAEIEIPAWSGVYKAKFRDLEVSEKTGKTQAYFYIDVKDKSGVVWRTVARCIVQNYSVVVDHYFPPVMAN